MVSFGYKLSKGDHIGFVKPQGKKIAILILYVVDVIITGDDLGEISYLKKKLSRNLK